MIGVAVMVGIGKYYSRLIFTYHFYQLQLVLPVVLKKAVFKAHILPNPDPHDGG